MTERRRAVVQPPKWSERWIANAVCRQVLDKRCLLLVPNCNAVGHECDVLAVTDNLQVIDIEIKISRSDFKADAKKDKWWHRTTYTEWIATGRPGSAWNAWEAREPVEWPHQVWKHYYVMPRSIWTPELRQSMASQRSGVILLRNETRMHAVRADVEKRAEPNKNAPKLGLGHVMRIARLANLRMWDAYVQNDYR